jgi:Zn-dependent protease with chaperone function
MTSNRSSKAFSFASTCLILLLLMLGCSFQSTHGQDFDQYQLLRSQGEIPEELLKPSSEKYHERVEAMKKDPNRRTHAARDKFLLQSSFMIDEMLLGGTVLFNDPVGQYLNEVKDHLLREQPELRDQIRVYLVKSPTPNAFATNDGTILFNMGLLTRLHNEAELAFALCHEFQHFIYTHPMRRYVATEKMTRKQVFTSGELAHSFLDRNQYSREQETEADEKGLELFLKGNYTLEAVDSMFVILRDARQPFAAAPWDLGFFESENLRFPFSYRLDSVSPFEVNEDQDDSGSSHPNIASRREFAAKKLADVDGAGRSSFVVSEEKFRKARKIARFEIAHLHLEQRKYESAIYHAHLLLQDNPGSFYLEKTIAQALYGLARHKNDRNFYEVHRDAELVQGEAQKLHFFLEQMGRAEMLVFAIDWCWRLHVKYPEDLELALICQDLLSEFFRSHREIAESMSNHPAPEGFFEHWQKEEAPVDEVLGTLEEDLKSLRDEPDPEDYYQHTFAGYFRNAEFATAYQNLILKEPETNEDEFMPPGQRRRAAKRKELNGEALGIDKVVFVEPGFKKIDERKKVQEDFIGSEKSRATFVKQIQETAGLAGLDQVILSNRMLDSTDMDRFNDLAVMERWIADYMRSQENSTRLVNLYAEEARGIAEKYGADHFAYTAVVELTRKKKPIVVTGMVLSSFLIFPIPLVVVSLLTPRQTVYYLNLVFDVEGNELLLEEGREISASPFRFIIKSQLYSSMHQMKLK